MPPIYVKGGAWTNVEDQILKAAVSKYGLTQWARVASLLTRKLANQAKARWNEWLSPLIDTLQWTREDDLKLLNLAQVMPNQWRLIAAQMGGKTATNCVERYQKLLDEAVSTHPDSSMSDLGLTGPGIEALPGSGPIQIGDTNLNAESRPAKPDDESLQDEEREMLMEAKARLANTQGKKAKRKARERMLDESKRIALLQKRREMKAAGIKVSLTLRNKKKEQFDYATEIPHHRKPPPGLYDIESENAENAEAQTQFTKKISHKGIELKEVQDFNNKKRREREARSLETKNSKVLSIESSSSEAPVKRRKLELPEVLEEATDVIDVDDEISRKARLLIAEKAEKSSLFLANHIKTGEDPKPDTSDAADAKADLLTLKIIREALLLLPAPLRESDMVFPIIDEVTPPPVLTIEGAERDEGEARRMTAAFHDRALEMQLLLRSQAVQRGLPLVRPLQVKKVKLNTQADALIYEEFKKLVNSDYKKYVNSNHPAQILNDLPKDAYDDALSEIGETIVEVQAAELHASRSTQEYSWIVTKLHALYEESGLQVLSLEAATDTSIFEESESTLQQKLSDHHAHLYNETCDLALASKLDIEENEAMSSALATLQAEVDHVGHLETAVLLRYRAVSRK